MIQQDGILGVHIGISRSGKTTPIKAIIKDKSFARRLIVWDSKREYVNMGLTEVSSLSNLLTILKQAKGAARIAYVPPQLSRKEFDSFCKLVAIWNRQAPCIAVVEELAAVTNCGKASGNWGVLVNQGLGFGLILLATVQRGQEIDKSVINNATYLYVAQHSTEDDVRYISKKIGVKMTDIPRQPLKFIVWSPSKGVLLKGFCEYRINRKKLPEGQKVAGAKPHFYTDNKMKIPLKIEYLTTYLPRLAS